MSKTPTQSTLPRFKVKTAAEAPRPTEGLLSRLAWRPDDVRLLKDTITTKGIPFALGGAAGAGIINLISAAKEEKRRRDFDEKMKQQGNSDIVIQVPSKAAADANTTATTFDPKTQGDSFSPLWRTSISLGVPALAAYGGYKLVDATTDMLAKKNMESRVNAAKRKYYDLITADPQEEEEEGIKTAGIPAYPIIESFCNKIAEEMTKIASPEVAPNGNTNEMNPVKAMEILTSIYPAIAIGSGVLAHKYIYDRRKDIDDLYAQKKDRINKKPKRIRFVTAPAGQPVQSIEQAPVQALTEQDLLSRVPTQEAVPIKQANQLLTTAALSTALSKNMEDISPESIADKMVQSDKEIQDADSPILDPTDVSGEDVVADKENITDVDDNTLMVDTPAGKVRVDASDPAAMAYIKNNKHVLASAINSAMQESLKTTGSQPVQN